MTEQLITASHLSKRFGNTIAVDDLNLQVSSGEIYGLVGPDGAGKTTTMRLLCGAYQPEKGSSIHIAGFDVLHQVEQARAQIGYLPQRFSLYEDLTVLENIRFFSATRGLSEKDWLPRCLEILEFVGLAGFTKRKAGDLSGGMKQKLGLAAALVHLPRVLLLDEPTTGVDPVTRQDFWQLIIQLVGKQDDHGTAVFISTPYMDEASRCTCVGFMRQGKLLVEGMPSKLCQPLEGRIIELTGKPLPLLRRIVMQEEGVEDVQMFGDRLHLRITAGASVSLIPKLETFIPLQGGQVDGIRIISPTLEDVFISLSAEPL